MPKQFHGKRDSVMLRVPHDVMEHATEAFRLRKLGFRGATDTGWKRAHQLVTKPSISIQDVRYIRNWYARHVHVSYPIYMTWIKHGCPETKEWFNHRGIISSLTWGGEAGLRWINSKNVRQLLELHFNKNYQKVQYA
jgi:hypothetical protein